MHGLMTGLSGMGGQKMDVTMGGMDVIGVMLGNGTMTVHHLVAAGRHVNGVTMFGMGGNMLDGNEVPEEFGRAVSLRRMEMTRSRRTPS